MLSWEQNSAGQLYVSIASGTLFLEKTNNNVGEDLIVFKLFGRDDKLAEKFSDDEIAYDPLTPEGFNSWFDICNALCELAKRRASGADDVLDSMIDELEDNFPF
jgi:hypothetical protein